LPRGREQGLMSGPLDGIRVVEITQFQNGPVCGRILGDLGAEVIKVEPKTGDPGRGFMAIVGVQLGIQGRNFYFEYCNRNKRGIVLDLKQPEGLEIFLKLIDEADVFVTNMAIGTPERLGIGYEALSARNPKLVYLQTTGWGKNGPDAKSFAYDYAGLARAGTMSMCGEEGTPPQTLVPGLADQMGAIMAAFGVVNALFARTETGRGQLVDTSMLGAMIELEGVVLSAPCILNQEFPRPVRSKAGNPLYNHYKCKDDRWIAIVNLQPDRYWPNVCRALEIAEHLDNPKFNNLESRAKNAEEMVRIIDERIATKPMAEWIEIFKREEVIFTPVQTATEVTNDPQALANNYFVWYDHPVFGRVKMTGWAWDFSETPCSIRREAPEFGQHTEEVLLEMGLDWDDIGRLQDKGII
jgi:crotonobetainyl-CoA:carnitine CoA-transferase CaiB-like acyl-CoA transferase